MVPIAPKIPVGEERVAIPSKRGKISVFKKIINSDRACYGRRWVITVKTGTLIRNKLLEQKFDQAVAART